MEATSCPSRPTRGLTPKGAEPNALGEANGKDAVVKKTSSKNNWNSVEKGERAKREEGGSCIYAVFAAISKWIWGKISGGGAGLVELMQDPFAMSRVVSKKGKINTHRDSQQRGLKMVLKDLFISSIHLSWSWTIFNFFASFVFSWAFFAIIWYMIALLHGDFVPLEQRAEGHRVCIDNVEDFTTSFLFSLETQHTIGYGGRATTSQCPVAIIVMSIQSIVGVFIDACMTGIVFAKFTKPTHRAKTIMFSKHALVTMRNGAFYLLCRVGDLRPTHLIESHISGYVVRNQVTEEGEEIPHHLHAIEFGTDLDGTQDFFQLFWPIVLSHRIDENSPLWEVSPEMLLTENFEIVLTMEGTTPETGNNIQVRTSYVPREILWGYKFEHSCVHFDQGTGKYEVTFDTLNTIVQDDTPKMSAQLYEEGKKRKEVEEGASPCPSCLSSANQSRRGSGAMPLSAIPKTFFGKARTKNKVHKLPGEKTE